MPQTPLLQIVNESPIVNPQSSMDMRVRFAPSPTGHLHVGNARTALFNWLLARGQGGTFILRIEDTDLERSTHESERRSSTTCAGWGWTGTRASRPAARHGPYRQSERLEIYREHADRLLAAGHAYYCFCSAETLEAERAGRSWPRACRRAMRARCRAHRSARERDAAHAAGEPAVVRLRVPADRDVSFHDLVRGDVTFHTDVIGDPVLVRSDGIPAYNYAVVIDDALMAITHVIRGEDHISNTPRQVLIYEAFGWTPPRFAHLSLVLGPDHAPLSKRHGATSVAEFREKGYLPEALVNYLALIGWSPRTRQRGERELLPADETRAAVPARGRVAQRRRVRRRQAGWVNRHYLKPSPGAPVGGGPARSCATRAWSPPSSPRTATLARSGAAGDRRIGRSAQPVARPSAHRLPLRRGGMLTDEGMGRELASLGRARWSRALAEDAGHAGPLLDRETSGRRRPVS